MSLTFAVEPFAQALVEIRPYWEAHWQEVGVYKDHIKLNVDIDFYQKAADIGLLHVIVARDNGKAVGYMAWMVKEHPRYKQSLTATADVFWLHPAYRKSRNGLAMFQFAEQYFASLGVQRLIGTCKVNHDLTRLYEGLGWNKVEYVFTKLV